MANLNSIDKGMYWGPHYPYWQALLRPLCCGPRWNLSCSLGWGRVGVLHSQHRGICTTPQTYSYTYYWHAVLYWHHWKCRWVCSCCIHTEELVYCGVFVCLLFTSLFTFTSTQEWVHEKLLKRERWNREPLHVGQRAGVWKRRVFERRLSMGHIAKKALQTSEETPGEGEVGQRVGA